jgi:hypothetical protein
MSYGNGSGTRRSAQENAIQWGGAFFEILAQLQVTATHHHEPTEFHTGLKMSVVSNTNKGRGRAIVKRLRRFSDQGRAKYSACVHQPNRSLNSDVNASHCRPLT